MKEENVIKLVRWGIGCVLLIVHAITKINSSLTLTAMVLLGVPFELATRKTMEDETTRGDSGTD